MKGEVSAVVGHLGVPLRPVHRLGSHVRRVVYLPGSIGPGRAVLSRWNHLAFDGEDDPVGIGDIHVEPNGDRIGFVGRFLMLSSRKAREGHAMVTRLGVACRWSMGVDAMDFEVVDGTALVTKARVLEVTPCRKAADMRTYTVEIA